MTKLTNAARPIRKKEQAFLERELAYWRETSLLDDGQAAAIAGLYEPAKERFLQVFMGLGAMLVGLGLLSYVAANWMEFGRALKVTLVVGAYLFSLIAAYGFEAAYPHTSSAFLLLGSFAYGAGIFLIAQIFNEGGAVTDALFWWMAGIAPACLLFKDRAQLLMTQGISLVYFHLLFRLWFWLFDSRGWFGLSSLPEYLLHALISYPFAVLLGLWVLWRLCGRWSVGFHMNVFITLNFFGIHASRFCGDAIALLLLFFAAGVLLCFAPRGKLKEALEGWGVFLTGLFGLVLSIPEFWRRSDIAELYAETLHPAFLNVTPALALSIAAAAAACAVLLWYVRCESLLAASFFCLTVLRYYFDFFYDFMNKALYFTAGGVLLMAMGFYLQRARRKKLHAKSEKEAMQP